MATSIFVNLPVADLAKSIEFFTRLGFSFNPQFTDETATCMIVADNIFVMLLTHAKFQGFTPKPICDAKASTEVLVCLSRESRARSTSWWARRSRPAGRPTTSRRTTASCTPMGSPIWMGISGSWSTWCPAPLAPLEERGRGSGQATRVARPARVSWRRT